MADICERCPQLRVLKVYNNKIDDEGVGELERIFQNCPGIEELHLSHNSLTTKGVEAIVQTADAQLLPRHGQRPL